MMLNNIYELRLILQIRCKYFVANTILFTFSLILIIITWNLCLCEIFVVFFLSILLLNYEIKIDWNHINSNSFINHTWINACHIPRPIYYVNINSLFNIIIHIYSFFSNPIPLDHVDVVIVIWENECLCTLKQTFEID